MTDDTKTNFPWYKKQLLTINEASDYYGIGYRTLTRFLRDHEDEDLVVYNGSRVLVKRKKFTKFLSDNVTVL